MMTVKLQIIVGICLFLALTVIVYMIKKRSLDLKYALSWLLALVFVLVLLKGDSKIALYDADSNTVKEISLSDVEKGDYLYARLEWSKVRMLYVIRK